MSGPGLDQRRPLGWSKSRPLGQMCQRAALDRGRTFFSWGDITLDNATKGPMAQSTIPCITHGEEIFLVRAVWEGELIAIDTLSVLCHCDGNDLFSISCPILQTIQTLGCA